MNSLSRLCPSLTLTIIIFHPHRWPILDERRSTKNFHIFFQHDMRQWVEVIYFCNWNFFPMRLTFFLKISRNFQWFAYILECKAQNNLRCKDKAVDFTIFWEWDKSLSHSVTWIPIEKQMTLPIVVFIVAHFNTKFTL